MTNVSLDALLEGHPAQRAVAAMALGAWPEHEKFLLRSFRQRSPDMIETGERVAAEVVKLTAGQEERFGADYRWTCDRLREEEIFFHREGRYRLATFAEATAECYSNHEYMGRYVRGLLLTQVLWFNHVATTTMYLARVLGAMTEPFDYLEVGPGHGLSICFAAASPLSRSLEAWDVSAASLAETRAALARLGVAKPVALVDADIMQAGAAGKRFDLIVLSEILEHLERPVEALASLRPVMSERARLFINVPINSPSPDHLALFASPDDVVALVEGAGLRVERLELYATQGRPVETALAQKISVSAGVVARPT